MGYIRHHAIVVTGSRWRSVLRDDDNRNTEIDDAHRAAIEAGCSVTPITQGTMNDTFSFLVVPDGSKEGWRHSDEGDAHRDQFIAWLRENSPESAGWFSWAEVVLGSDDNEAHVERHAWDESRVRA